MFDFPSTPTSGQKYPAAPVAGLPQYTWDGEKWTTIGGATTGAAPSTVTPLMDATPAVVGVSTKYAREDHVHPSDTARVAKAGDIMTGPLNISAVAPLIGLQAIGSTSQAVLAAYRDGLTRWNVVMTIGPEPGGNAGSDFAINRFTDSGSYIDSPISISRANGRVSLTGDPTSPLNAATKQYVDNKGISEATDSDMWTGTSAVATVTPRRAATVQAWSLLIDAPTILVSQSAGRNFRLNSMAGNRILGFISSAVAGTEGIIAIKQDGVGSRTLNVSTAGYICDGDTPFVIGTVASKWSVIGYKVFDNTHVLLQLIAINCSLG